MFEIANKYQELLQPATVFAASVLLAWLFQKYVRPEAGDALMASLIFVPVLIFLVGDRKLIEVSGFGFAVKLEEAGASRLDDVFSEQLTEDLPQDLTMASPDELAAYFQACERHFVIRTNLVPDWKSDMIDPYVVYATEAIRGSLACGRLIGVIVLDEDDSYVGSYDAGFFQESLSLWTIPTGTSKEAVAASIRQRTIFGTALVHPTKRLTPGEGYVAAINERATLFEAFEAFEEIEGEMLVITDTLGRMKGVLDRQAVRDKILGKVVSSLSADD
ncbi:hypothetical protein CLV78_101477 [Aliiruegeria haliotis]|uniref:CBS domain protein n=1 Tax=Aliiruegeria haliotis TaxID=1280846 RepID=A0A2T0RZ18_9RHOB|nr:hypothetical protein [Aliiruegeria haliotis]PRY26382.1 hypothetical protein CLV78_101477 [Aliiruegeria haliotis]